MPVSVVAGGGAGDQFRFAAGAFFVLGADFRERGAGGIGGICQEGDGCRAPPPVILRRRNPGTARVHQEFDEQIGLLRTEADIGGIGGVRFEHERAGTVGKLLAGGRPGRFRKLRDVRRETLNPGIFEHVVLGGGAREVVFGGVDRGDAIRGNAEAVEELLAGHQLGKHGTEIADEVVGSEVGKVAARRILFHAEVGVHAGDHLMGDEGGEPSAAIGRTSHGMFDAGGNAGKGEALGNRRTSLNVVGLAAQQQELVLAADHRGDLVHHAAGAAGDLLFDLLCEYGDFERLENQVVGVGECCERGTGDGGGGGEAGADGNRGIADDVGAGCAAGELFVLGENRESAGEIRRPVPRAFKEPLQRFHRQERCSAVEIVHREFDAGLRGIAAVGVVEGVDDDAVIVTPLHRNGGGEIDGQFAHEAAGVVGNAAHHVKAAGCAGDAEVLVGFRCRRKNGRRCGLQPGEQFRNRGQRLTDGNGGGRHERTPMTGTERAIV